MPDHNREVHPLHTLTKSVGEDGIVRCPNCPGLTRVTFQAECVCCGREVTQNQDSETDEITGFVQALSIGSGTPAPLPASRAFVGENQPPTLFAASSSSYTRRQRRNYVSILRNLSDTSNRPEITRRQQVETVNQSQLPYRSRNTLRTLFQQLQYEQRPPSHKRWARNSICKYSSLFQRSSNLQTRQE